MPDIHLKSSLSFSEILFNKHEDISKASLKNIRKDVLELISETFQLAYEAKNSQLIYSQIEKNKSYLSKPDIKELKSSLIREINKTSRDLNYSPRMSKQENNQLILKIEISFSSAMKSDHLHEVESIIKPQIDLLIQDVCRQMINHHQLKTYSEHSNLTLKEKDVFIHIQCERQKTPQTSIRSFASPNLFDSKDAIRSTEIHKKSQLGKGIPLRRSLATPNLVISSQKEKRLSIPLSIKEKLQ